jgi:ketosteroid isomerase-like protein
MSEQNYRRIVEQYYDYVDEEEYESLFSLMADEITYHHGFEESYDGLDEVKDLYENRPAFQDGAHDIQNIIVEGDDVAVRGETWMVLEDGSRTETRFALFHHFNDRDEIGEQWLYLERR